MLSYSLVDEVAHNGGGELGQRLRFRSLLEIFAGGRIASEFAQAGQLLHRQIGRRMCRPTRRKKALSHTSTNPFRRRGFLTFGFAAHLRRVSPSESSLRLP